MRNKPKEVHLTFFEVELIVAMYQDGTDIIDIVRYYKISQQRVINILLGMEVYLYNSNYVGDDLLQRNEMIIKMHKDGISMEDIANHYGLTRQWIYYVIKRSAPEIISRQTGRKPKQNIEDIEEVA